MRTALASSLEDITEPPADSKPDEPLKVDRAVSIIEGGRLRQPGPIVLVRHTCESALVRVVAAHHIEGVVAGLDSTLHTRRQQDRSDAVFAPALVLVD